MCILHAEVHEVHEIWKPPKTSPAAQRTNKDALKASALVPGMLQCHGVGVLLSPVQTEGTAHGLDI